MVKPPQNQTSCPQKEMQNAECKMLNGGIHFVDIFNHFPKENTSIQHSSFSILHFVEGARGCVSFLY